MSPGEEIGPSEDYEWRRALAALEAGDPVVWCERPSLAAGIPTVVRGDLEFAGWAVSTAGIESVTVEVETRGSFAASLGSRRPDVHRLFFPAPWGRRPGFELTLPTADWLPGIYGVRVSARDARGSSTAVEGRVEWLPSQSQITRMFASGVPALWVGEPRYDAGDPLANAVWARGWVSARPGVSDVVVELEGAEPARAFVGAEAFEPDDALPKAAFAVALDAPGLPTGHRMLTIEAAARDGSISRRSGQVVIDPGERYRRRLARRPRDRAPTPAAAAAAGLRMCVIEGPPRAALQSSLAAQTHPPAAFDNGAEGIETALRSLLESRHAATVFVASRDVLHPDALARVAARFDASPPPDLVYSDHDVIDDEGHRSDPFPKPGWSPELLLSLPYVGSFLAVGRGGAEAALRVAGDRLQSVHALLLALLEEPLRVERIPEVLWSRQPREFAEVAEGEDAALQAVARRRGARLKVKRRDSEAGVREVCWVLERHPAVSIVIPTSGSEMPLAACLRSLRDRTAYRDVEIILVDSGGGARETAAGALGNVEHRVVAFDGDGQFNFSRACNLGAEAARGEYLAFLNDDTEAVDAEWLERMVAQAELPATGVVGAKLLYPGGLVQHAGLVIDRLPAPAERQFVAAQFAFHQEGAARPHRLLEVPRDCSAVTGACLVVPTGLLRDLGGWDEGFRIDFGDVDLCLRALGAGRRVVVEPRARLIHRVHATRGQVPQDEDDRRRFMNRWAVTYAGGDPWYHPGCAFARDWELR